MGTTHQYAFGTQLNQLLAALPPEILNRWQDRLEPVELSRNEILYGSGRIPDYVYFPTTGIVSLMNMTSDGASAEVAVVGNDGVVGISYLLGADSVDTSGTVQSAGRAFRISARFVKAEIEHSCAVMKIVMHYAQSVISQMAQTAICNRYHTIEQQFSRRLLLSLDRLPTSKVEMTHELAANLLGVRREGITGAANKLKDEGMIDYSRGRIIVLDRDSLERNACECYGVSKKHFSRLLPVRSAA